MIVKQDLVKKIKEYFNLNIYETKVWLALISKGIASAGEIAEISEVPRSRTYDVLESLEKRGFAIVKICKPVKYIAVKPTEIIEKMKTQAAQEAQEKITSLSNLKDTQEYIEIEKLHQEGISPVKSHEITGSVKGNANINSKIKGLLENAEKEVVINTSLSDFEKKSRMLLPTIERLNQNNVKVRIALSGDQDKIKRLSTKHNLKIKPVNTQSRIFIADQKETLFMLTPETAEEDLGIWLNTPFFALSLSNLLEQSLRA